jgi:hypothetical protein
VRTLLIIALALSITGCGRGNPPAAPANPPHASLAEQQMCAVQAQHQYAVTTAGSPLSSFTNHFDPQTRVCFVMIHWINGGRDNVTVRDAFEDRLYAYYSGPLDGRVEPATERSTTCYVEPPGGAMILCKWSGEFEFLVRKHYGLEWAEVMGSHETR